MQALREEGKSSRLHRNSGLIQAFPAPQPMNFIAASAAAKKQTRNDFIGDFRETKETVMKKRR